MANERAVHSFAGDRGPVPERMRGDMTSGSETGTGAPATGGPGRAPRWDEDVEAISLVALVNVLLKRWKLVAGLPLAAAFLAAVIVLLVPARFTATASFVPEGESSAASLPGGLAGIAAQFGVGIGGGGAESPAFYAQLLQSRTLQDQVLRTIFADPRAGGGADSAALLDILDIEGDSEEERLENGREELSEMISTRVNDKTDVVSVWVETRYPELSADVANLCIDLLGRFNLETRQSNAAERRRFIESRVAEAEAELRRAEDTLQAFFERNRQYQGSPELRFQADRLQRQVTLKQEVLSTLRREYEEARIQEVNDTPVITVIDRAVPPQEKSSPKRRLNVILAFVVGGVLGVLGAFGREFADRARASDEAEYEEFSSRWAEIKVELRSALSWPRRAFKSRR